jgi:hypothetical protein
MPFYSITKGELVMNEELNLEQRVSLLETQLSILMGIVAMSLEGNKAEKKEALSVLAELDKVVNPAAQPT